MFEHLVPNGGSVERIRRQSGWRRCASGMGFEVSKDLGSQLALSPPAFGSRHEPLPITPLPTHACSGFTHGNSRANQAARRRPGERKTSRPPFPRAPLLLGYHSTSPTFWVNLSTSIEAIERIPQLSLPVESLETVAS